MTLEKLNDKIVVLEKKTEQLDHRVSSMERHNEVLQDLKIAVEILAHTNEVQNKEIETQSKNQSQQFDRLGATLSNLDESIAQMNLSQSEIKADVKNVTVQVTESKNHIRKIEEEYAEGKIDPRLLTKQILLGFITSVGIFALGYLVTQMGAK